MLRCHFLILRFILITLSGAVNFVFGLPAIKTIDTLGRRKWLITTLPLMCIFMLMGSLSFPLPYDPKGNTGVTVRLVTIYLYCKFLFGFYNRFADKVM